MARVTAIATILVAEDEVGVSELDLSLHLPFGLLPFELFAPLAEKVRLSQLIELHAKVRSLRRTFSSAALTHLVLHRITPDELTRRQVGSDAAWAEIRKGGVLISLITDPGFRGEERVGRPPAQAIDDAFKRAFGEAVARLLVLGMVADGGQYENYERQYNELGKRLTLRASLFNLNEDHARHHPFPVLNWCEENGPRLLAAGYGMESHALDHALEAAFEARLRHRSFEAVLEGELARIETLMAWSGAYSARREGAASRRDTTRRLLDENGLDWETAPGAIAPPKMANKVRRRFVAQQTLSTLSTRAMVEASMLFNLEPAHDVLLTRLYLRPILATAGLAGRVGLRRRPGAIADLYTAVGCVAQAENLLVPDAPALEEDGDEIDQLQALVRQVLERSGLSINDLAVRGYGYLQTEQDIVVAPPPGPRLFFLEA